ncbi:MAG TPA: hypothetical protein VNH18_00140 [Bryobacteraceae bacterium]|nr:hypothetical protein [Bryobacteraceae bacterium]
MEFEKIFAGLVEAYRAVGPEETYLARMMAECYCRIDDITALESQMLRVETVGPEEDLLAQAMQQAQACRKHSKTLAKMALSQSRLSRQIGVYRRALRSLQRARAA